MNFRLPSPRINLSEIVKIFQTVVVAEQARERLKDIKQIAGFGSLAI